MENNNKVKSSDLTVVSADAVLEGKIIVSSELHFYGKIKGEIEGLPGSRVILKEGSVVEGLIRGDRVTLEGFVQGEIRCTEKCWVTSRGKFIGSITTPSIQVDPGAIFEAKIEM